MGKTVADMIRALQNVNVVEITKSIMLEEWDEVERLNRAQLYDGLDSDGNFLSPRYSEDPFFKNAQDAKRYAEWKQQITPNPNRPFDVPNLYINGFFHYSRVFRLVENRMVFDSDYNRAPEINRKYKKLDGLTPKSIQRFRETVLYPQLLKKIADLTGLGVR